MGLCRTDGKRLDGVTVIPWSKSKCFTRDVTVPDTFATLHVNDNICAVRKKRSGKIILGVP